MIITIHSLALHFPIRMMKNPLFTCIMYTAVDQPGLHDVMFTFQETLKPAPKKLWQTLRNFDDPVCDLSSPLMYHGAIGCVRSVKDCPTAYRLCVVPLPR